MVQYIRKLVDELIRSKRCEIDSPMSIQIGGIQCLLLEIHVTVTLTLMMACSPKNSRKELHSRNTTHIVTITRARFISPCLLDCDTFVRAFLIPLKKWMNCVQVPSIKVSYLCRYLLKYARLFIRLVNGKWRCVTVRYFYSFLSPFLYIFA